MAAWFYQLMGEEVGPVSSSQIRKAAVDRRIQPDTLVRREGSSEWVSADRIRGLFDDQGIAIDTDSRPTADSSGPPHSFMRPHTSRVSKDETTSLATQPQPEPLTFAGVVSAPPTTDSTNEKKSSKVQSSTRGGFGNALSHREWIGVGVFVFALLIVAYVSTNLASSGSDSSRPSDSSNTSTTANADPLQQLKAFAKDAFERSKLSDGTSKTLSYRVDVKKTDSLSTPFFGRISVERAYISEVEPVLWQVFWYTYEGGSWHLQHVATGRIEYVNKDHSLDEAINIPGDRVNAQSVRQADWFKEFYL